MGTGADIRRAYTRNSSNASTSTDTVMLAHAHGLGACYNHATDSNADADVTSQSMHLVLCFVHAQTTQTYEQTQQAKACISCIKF